MITQQAGLIAYQMGLPDIQKELEGLVSDKLVQKWKEIVTTYHWQRAAPDGILPPDGLPEDISKPDRVPVAYNGFFG